MCRFISDEPTHSEITITQDGNTLENPMADKGRTDTIHTSTEGIREMMGQ